MAILIKGMEMPKDGVYWCEIGVAGDIATITIHGEERKSFPLVPVPEPHGRCIDADALKKVVASAKHMDADIYDGRLFYSDHLCVGADYDDVCKAIDETPTIIPASKESET